MEKQARTPVAQQAAVTLQGTQGSDQSFSPVDFRDFVSKRVFTAVWSSVRHRHLATSFLRRTGAVGFERYPQKGGWQVSNHWEG